MIEIDGSYGSGGGQILRTAVGLSAFTLIPCKIYNIRAKRGNPGLREQHLQAISSIKELCDAEAKGLEIGSTNIEFYPKEIKKNNLNVKIGTAGSVGLVLQALLIPAMKLKELTIKINGGGTWGKWAPPTEYIKQVLAKLLLPYGFFIDVSILKEGFYPKGGAEVKVTIKTSNFKPFDLTEKKKILSIKGLSIASLSLKQKKVAERQRDSVISILHPYFKIMPQIDVRYVDSLSVGSGLLCYIVTENSVIGADSLGELGKRSEDIGKEVAQNLIQEYENGVVDSHMADQILPFLALAGGKIQVSKITEHCKTNAYIIEKFLSVKFLFENNNIIRIEKLS